MNRKQFRAISKKLSREEFDARMDATRDEVVSTFLLVALNVMADKYGWNEEQIRQLTLDLIDEYNAVDDFSDYKEKTYNKIGVTIERSIDDIKRKN